MIKKCLMKLSIVWVFRHKERYVLSWISFAVVSVFFIFVYSIAGGIHNQVSDYIRNDSTTSQINIQCKQVSEEGFIDEMDQQEVTKLAQELKVQGVRALQESEACITGIDYEDMQGNQYTIASFYTPWGLMLKNDYNKSTIVEGDIEHLSDEQIVVTDTFLKQANLATSEAIGKTIRLDNGKEYIIAAAIVNLPQGSFLNQYLLFIPNDEMSDGIDYVTFDFPQGTDISEQTKTIMQAGIPYSTNSIQAERMNEIASQYSMIGSIVGGILSITCIICLINSQLVTINENASFMELFHLMGLTRKNYLFMNCFTSGLSGLIGGIMGVLLSLCTTGFLYQWLRQSKLKGLDIISELKFDWRASLLAVLICVIVSACTGAIALLFSLKNDAESIADSELI